MSEIKKINRIIVVGGDKLEAYQTQLLLESMQIADQIITIADGWDAIQYVVAHHHNKPELAGEQPDLLFLDTNVLDQNDYQFLLNLNSLGVAPERLQLVVLNTGEQAEEKIMQGSLAGNVLAYLRKPLSRESLKAIIERETTLTA